MIWSIIVLTWPGVEHLLIKVLILGSYSASPALTCHEKLVVDTIMKSYELDLKRTIWLKTAWPTYERCVLPPPPSPRLIVVHLWNQSIFAMGTTAYGVSEEKIRRNSHHHGENLMTRWPVKYHLISRMILIIEFPKQNQWPQLCNFKKNGEKGKAKWREKNRTCWVVRVWSDHWPALPIITKAGAWNRLLKLQKRIMCVTGETDCRS